MEPPLSYPMRLVFYLFIRLLCRSRMSGFHCPAQPLIYRQNCPKKKKKPILSTRIHCAAVYTVSKSPKGGGGNLKGCQKGEAQETSYRGTCAQWAESKRAVCNSPTPLKRYFGDATPHANSMTDRRKKEKEAQGNMAGSLSCT